MTNGILPLTKDNMTKGKEDTVLIYMSLVHGHPPCRHQLIDKIDVKLLSLFFQRCRRVAGWCAVSGIRKAILYLGAAVMHRAAAGG